MIIQDSINSYQAGYSNNDSEYHRYCLVGPYYPGLDSFQYLYYYNSIQTLSYNFISSGTIFYNQFIYKIDSAWGLNKIRIISLIMKRDTTYFWNPNNQTFFSEVVYKYVNGNDTATLPLSIDTTINTTEASILNLNSEINCFLVPNPSSDLEAKLYLYTPFEADYEIYIYNLSGIDVFHYNGNMNNFKIIKLPLYKSGLYNIHVKINKLFFYLKWVKN